MTATFHLFLPLGRSAAIEESRPVDANPTRVRFRRILIVEDEPAVADGIAAVLRLEGTLVEVASTGAAMLGVAACGAAIDADWRPRVTARLAARVMSSSALP